MNTEEFNEAMDRYATSDYEDEDEDEYKELVMHLKSLSMVKKEQRLVGYFEHVIATCAKDGFSAVGRIHDTLEWLMLVGVLA